MTNSENSKYKVAKKLVDSVFEKDLKAKSRILFKSNCIILPSLPELPVLLPDEAAVKL